MISIELHVDTKELDELSRRLNQMEGVLASIGRELVSATIKRIERGVPPPNAPLTQAWKKGSNTPLRDTGRLMGSITYQVGPDWVKVGTIKVGTNVPYARIQQLGGTIRPKDVKKLAIPAGWHTRKLMRQYGETPRKCLEGLRRTGWKIWFREGSIMGQPPKRGRAKAEPVVLFIRKSFVSIPSRPFLVVEEKEKKMIMRRLYRWLTEGRI